VALAKLKVCGFFAFIRATSEQSEMNISRVSRVSRTGVEVELGLSRPEQSHVGQEVRKRRDSGGETEESGASSNSWKNCEYGDTKI